MLFHIPVDQPLDGATMPLLLRGKSACTIRRVGERYRASFVDGHHEFLTPDSGGCGIAHEGTWWYRGVYVLEAYEEGCLLRVDVYNAAKRWRWLVRLLNRGGIERYETAFQNLAGLLTAALRRAE